MCLDSFSLRGVLWLLASVLAFAALSCPDPEDEVEDTGAVTADLADDLTAAPDSDEPDAAELDQETPDLPPEVDDDGETSELEDREDEISPCHIGEWSCSDDAFLLNRCREGRWTVTDCMRGQGRLCQDGECVDPWRYGSPVFGTCPDEPRATPETLAEKAAGYDDVARRLHIHPELRWIANVTLSKQSVECPVGQEPPCFEPAVDPSLATWEDVERWHTGENDGLWSALYLTSQAYRYAVTASPQALENIRILLEGEVWRMRITGVPGLFTRQYIPPGVDGIACPQHDSEYTTDAEKDDNRWVSVREDGCVWVVDHETDAWTQTEHCGLDDFAGWCWLDNVSQDEYVGHMFALGALYRLVDDPEVQAIVRDLLEQIGVHLMDNELTFVDWDGRLTEHGRLYPLALGDTPGYLAVMALDFVLLAAEASGREDLREFYDLCLLQRAGERQCLSWPLQPVKPFTEFLGQTLAYRGPDGCTSNWNNFSMLLANYHHLLWFERDPELRATLQEVLARELILPDHPRALIVQGNPWYNFMWASQKPLGPQSDGPAFAAVEQGICGLKQFPASKATRAADSAERYPHDCEGRLGNSLAEHPIPIADRCASTFLFWRNPYGRGACSSRPWELRQPGDYLLAYWMGRYYGFIPADL